MRGESPSIKIMQTKDEMQTEAIEMFYEWETENGITSYSDDDRLKWIAGYIYCKENVRGFY